MVQDYPDCYDHVDRSPVQKTGYQIYGIYSSTDISANASSDSSSIWNIPNDGYSYAIDTIFYVVNHLLPFEAYLDLANDQSSPTWYSLAEKKADGSTIIEPSRMGAFVVTYPMALRFRIHNYRASSVLWSYFCNYFKYLVGS